MEYNLHPIIVHFPIALLVLYSLIKILPVHKWFPQNSWKTTERVLLLVGFVGLLLASSSGEVAQDLTRPDKDLVDMHELFASASTWFYGILLALEFLPDVNSFLSKKNIIRQKLSRVINSLILRFSNKTLVVLLALLGLGALSLTGLLGGVMVHGVSADPIAPFVLRILGL